MKTLKFISDILTVAILYPLAVITSIIITCLGFYRVDSVKKNNEK